MNKQRGRVIANHGSDVILKADSGDTITATPRKKLGLLVTGDLVHWQHQETGNATVMEVLPRSGTLERTDRTGRAKPIATHVSQLMVVTAPKPPFDTLLIDRYCVAAQCIGADVVIIINKADLLDNESEATAAAIESLYHSLEYRVLRCSAKHTRGMQAISNVLQDEISILVGQSGVGKSSLLNALLPVEQARTGALSENSGLGRHTTTVTNWYSLQPGGAIIDSPGVRQFSLEHVPNADIQAGFREIAALAGSCKFNNCTHSHEPDCAVIAGLSNSLVSTTRYEHFRSLTEE